MIIHPPITNKGYQYTCCDIDVSDAPLIPLAAEDSARITNFIRGNKFFELSNHLGNVLATVADTKQAISVNGTTVDHYEADVASANDYYPFGMLQPGRSWNAGGYRYWFNGKENDGEVKGEGNQQDYGMRVYDPRVGRFLSVDPITAQYPELTPYQFASNLPITSLDLDGLEGVDFRDAKVNKLSYNNLSWYQDPLGLFASNSLRSAWNQGVDAVQLSVNFAADPKGTINSIKRGITSAVFRGLRWLSETRDDDKVDFVRKEITNVHNYEDIAGSILLGKVGTPRSSGLSLGGDAVEGEGLTLFRKGNTGVFSELEVPMRLKDVKNAAGKAGVGLKGVKIKIDRDVEKIAAEFPYLASAHGNTITLFPKSFTNMETLVRTLGHERTHVMQYQLWGKNAPFEMVPEFEKAAYNIEPTFWNFYKTNGKL